MRVCWCSVFDVHCIGLCMSALYLSPLTSGPVWNSCVLLQSPWRFKAVVHTHTRRNTSSRNLSYLSTTSSFTLHPFLIHLLHLTDGKNCGGFSRRPWTEILQAVLISWTKCASRAKCLSQSVWQIMQVHARNCISPLMPVLRCKHIHVDTLSFLCLVLVHPRGKHSSASDLPLFSFNLFLYLLRSLRLPSVVTILRAAIYNQDHSGLCLLGENHCSFIFSQFLSTPFGSHQG